MTTSRISLFLLSAVTIAAFSQTSEEHYCFLILLAWVGVGFACEGRLLGEDLLLALYLFFILIRTSRVCEHPGILGCILRAARRC